MQRAESWIVEESEVDVEGKVLTCRTRNLDHVKVMEVIETTTLKEDTDGATIHKTEARFRSGLGWGLKRRIEEYSASKFKANIEKSRMGLALVVRLLREARLQSLPPPFGNRMTQDGNQWSYSDIHAAAVSSTSSQSLLSITHPSTRSPGTSTSQVAHESEGPEDQEYLQLLEMDSPLEKDKNSVPVPASSHDDTPTTTPTTTSLRIPFFVSLASLVCLVGLYIARMTGPSAPPTPESNDIVTQLGEDVDTIGNFRLTQKIKLNYTDVTITKWQSQQTGLRVVHVDYEGPIINGYFAVATEITDDSGCPHTLEHLIFHGSDQYPYSDALPRIVSRSFSSTPNAWTATDNTVYTLSTAGEASFLQLLPVFVDHILYPQLTESTFTTEVHHIDKEGKDAGVVYSEMQGRQNTAPDLMDLAYRRKLYPEGNGYRSETGGMMEALRKLSLAEIQAYHSKYYAPHNLCL
ncbi:2676_t:CDS:2, partial [Acaulospora colombiana]